MGSLLFFILLCFLSHLTLAHAVPFQSVNRGRALEGTGKNSLIESPSALGCRYKASNYDVGEEVETDEPCLACQCKSTAVVCKLRVCPEIPIPPPPGCIVVHKAKKCCSQLVCTESNRKISREQRLPLLTNDSTSVLPLGGGKGSCVYEGTVYAEGSAMKSSTLCQYCFCIRGEMKCSSPQCVIPLNGCKPKFRSYACCPTNYDCLESTGSSIVKSVESSTPLPSFLKGCQVKGKFVAEGDPVLPLALDPDQNHTNPCQTCFCMGGVIRCRPLECDRPIENCRSVKEDGHCCPDRYECEDEEGSREAATTPPTLGLPRKEEKTPDVGSREERRNRNDYLPSEEDAENFGRRFGETSEYPMGESNMTLVFEDTTVYHKPEQNTEKEDESGTELIPESESVTLAAEVGGSEDDPGRTSTEKPIESFTSPSEPEKGVEEEEKPTTASRPSPPPDTTLNNVHFISFGVEDAVMGLQDSAAKKTSAVYDHMALRGSLIPPTPPKGYVKVQLQNSDLSTPPSLSSETLNFSIAKNGNGGKSSSLYSNGHYSHASHTGSNRPAASPEIHDLREEERNVGVGEAVVVHSAKDEIHEIGGGNPSRIYSKFGLQDSAHYRYRFGHGDGTSEGSTYFPSRPSGPNSPHYHPSGIRDEIYSEGLEEDYDESLEGLFGSKEAKTSEKIPFPPPMTKKPGGGELTMLGLKLSGCNIYGIMYNLGDVIHELASPCVQCRCTEIGVQCEEIPC